MKLELEFVSANLKGDTEKFAVEYLIDKYKSLGYNCKRTVDLSYDDLLKHNFVKMFGMPDLTVWNSNEFFMVEVKTDSGLIPSQIKWMKHHQNIKTIICVVENKNKIVSQN